MSNVFCLWIDFMTNDLSVTGLKLFVKVTFRVLGTGTTIDDLKMLLLEMFQD